MNKPAFIGGLAFWSLFEYGFHRFLLHGPLRRFHRSHHAHPEADGFDWKPSIVGGFLAGYVIYSYVHAKLHRGVAEGKLKERHDFHHVRPRRNFGVTTSFWDRMFRTLEEAPAKQRSLVPMPPAKAS